jgi:hypothetical protein
MYEEYDNAKIFLSAHGGIKYGAKNIKLGKRRIVTLSGYGELNYGCEQMYCPMCKIIFSYRTGFRLFGTVHQPDAVRDLRLGIMNRNGEVPRDPADIPCEGVSGLRMKFATYTMDLYSNEKILKM